MKMKNIVLVGLLNTLGTYSEFKLPQKIGYAITRNMITIQKEYAVYEQQMQKIFKNFEEYTLKDDEGNLLFEENGLPKVEKSQQENLANEMNELLNIEVDIDLYYIDISAFDYEDSARFDPLSPNDILLLQSILCKQNN